MKVKIGDCVENAQGESYVVCGIASFGHEITDAQAQIIALVSCMNCSTPHKTYVDRLRNVNVMGNASRAQDDSGDSGTIVWGK